MVVTLVQGSVGPEVKNLQRALNFHIRNEIPPLTVDSIFGPKTKARLTTFQRTHNLKPDAIVGPKTRAALYSFVQMKPALILQTADRQARRSSLVGDNNLPPIPPFPQLRLPPFPGLRVPLPSNALSLPSFPHFKLELDPQFKLFLRTQPFEIAAGSKMVFKKRQDDSKPGGVAFLDVTATVWSTPIVGEKFKAVGQLGFAGETRIDNGRTEASLSGGVGVELKDVLKLGAVDIFTLQVQAGFEKGLDQKPVDMKATLETGPTVETKDGRFSFGAGGFLEIKTNGVETELSSGVFVKGAVHF